MHLESNFLVRTREGLAGMGFMTVLVDAPSDRQNATGLTGGFRATLDHAKVLAAVAAHFHTEKEGFIRRHHPDWKLLVCAWRTEAPVLVVGSSAGTVSATLAAFQVSALPAAPLATNVANSSLVRGVALTSSITSGMAPEPTILNLPRNAIRMPVLFVHHTGDACASSTYANATDTAFGTMKHSAKVGFVEVSGGFPENVTDPCEGGTLHGFAHSGAAALSAIEKWIAAEFKR